MTKCPKTKCPKTKCPKTKCPKTKCPKTKCPKTKCPKAKRRATSLRLLKCKFIIFKKIQQIKTDFPEKNEQKSFLFSPLCRCKIRVSSNSLERRLKKHVLGL
jgi:hypothetical protein